MADYFPLLSRAVSSLPESTPETRRAVYDRARKALLGQLRTIQPPMEESAIEAENDALDEAIARIESEAGPGPEAEAPEPTIAPVAPPSPPRQTAAPARAELPPARTPLRPLPPLQPRTPYSPKIESAPPAPPAEPRFSAAGKSSRDEDLRADRTADRNAGEDANPDIDRDAESAPAVAIRAPGLRPDPAFARESARPAAPVAPRASGFNRRIIWLGLALLICAGVGALAWNLRVPPEDFSRPRAGVADSDASKAGQRAGQSEAIAPASSASPNRVESAQRSAPPQQTVPVSQRAAILIQAAVNDQQNITTHVGATLWRLVASERVGASGQPAIRADVDLPEIRMRLTLTIEKNTDPTLRASHTMTLRFASEPGVDFPVVAELGAPQMRNESTPAVDQLASVQAKITDNIFIVALTGEAAFAARNIETMRTRGWFDFPLRMSDRRVAKITLEKGALGDRLFEEAFEAWK